MGPKMLELRCLNVLLGFNWGRFVRTCIYSLRKIVYQSMASTGVLAEAVKRINEWLPDTWMLENVKSLANKKHKKIFDQLLKKPL